MALTDIPRLIVAATGSGVGKTTVAVGLIAALRARGMRVAPFKCGPDYLDPSYHTRAAARRSQNLDGWMMGREGVLQTFASASRDADIAVIEGMMGLYDSADPASDEGSTAEIAKWLQAPVLLVVDASGMARSVGAMALGYARFDRRVRLAGLIANRLGGRGHLELLRQAQSDRPILGGLPVDPAISFPERHLGLLAATASIVPQARLESLGELVADWFDLEKIIELARSAPGLEAPRRAWQDTAVETGVRIGVAFDEAFHFYYEYNLARLRELGAEIIQFSPVHDRELPPVDGLYFGGGYPEESARELAENRAMREAISEYARRGKPIYAECGGLMFLAEGIRTSDGATRPMVGLIPGIAVMSDRLQAIGYVEVETTAPSFLGDAGTRWRGHQFRYSTLEPGAANEVERIYRVTPRWGGGSFVEGWRRADVIASYVHAHWASNPEIPANFVAACARTRSAAPDARMKW